MQPTDAVETAEAPALRAKTLGDSVERPDKALAALASQMLQLAGPSRGDAARVDLQLLDDEAPARRSSDLSLRYLVDPFLHMST